MTDIKTRGKLPFTIVSSSVNTGYAAQLSSSVGYNLDIVNIHKDDYAELEGTPLQSPFTQQHVGGNQHRHVKLNDGNDTQNNRPEAYIISTSTNSIKVYGPDVNGVDKPRSQLTRDLIAKSPINISNIRTSGNIAGNFEYNYQVFQSVGRRTSNNLINDNFIASGALTTQFVSGSHQVYTLPNIVNNSKSVFVERFNAPGGKQESPRGALDREGEEYSPNNSLVTRNISVRQPYYNKLTQHSAQFNSGSTYKILPDIGTVNAVSIHGINRNTLNKIKYSGEVTVTASSYDNFWVQHSIPSTDLRYKWITSSLDTSQQPIEYQSYRLSYSSGSTFSGYDAYSDIKFIQSGSFGDHYGISGAIDKDQVFISDQTNTFYRNRRYLALTSSNDFYIEANSVAPDITEKDFSISFWINIPKDSTSLVNLVSASYISSGQPVQDTDSPNDIQDVYFKYDLSKMYVINQTSTKRKIYQYYFIGQKGLLSNLIYEKSASVELGVSDAPRDLHISADGTKLYVLYSSSSVGSKILNYTLTSSWEIDSLSSPTTHIVTEDRLCSGIYFKPDGTKVYLCSFNTSPAPAVYEKTLSTPWDLTTTGSTTTLLTGFQYQSIRFSKDGKRMYLLSSASDVLRYYNLSTAWSISTAVRDTKNEMAIGAYDSNPLGLYVDEDKNTLYIGGNNTNKIYQFGLHANKLIEYSGSISSNVLNLKIDNSGSYFYVNGLNSYNTNFIRPNINDGKWHNVVLVNDLYTTIKKINASDVAVNNNIVNVYVDGALVNKTVQLWTKIDIQKILFFPEPSQYDCSFDEIYVWDKVLTLEEINKIFNISKIYYGDRPKKYVEHKFNNTNIIKPRHVFSSRVDSINKILFNETTSNITASLIGYSEALNIKPALKQNISYSTYFNGPYGHPSWKMIRGAEHPITRKLTTENTNIISILRSDTSKTINRVVNGRQISIVISGAKREGALLNVKEPPVYINKPLKHKFIFKGSRNNTKKGYEITHTYENNLNYFANNNLNNALGLSSKEEDQVYDVLYDYYGNDYVDEKESPVEKFLGYTLEENIFPKKSEAFFKSTRYRETYITNEPGYGLDGYDRQLGTQRAFWRDLRENRMRTSGSMFNSMGHQVMYGNIHSPSLAALEKTNDSLYVTELMDSSSNSVLMSANISELKGAELNNKSYHKIAYVITASTNAVYIGYYSPISMSPEYYFYINGQLTGSGLQRFNPLFASGNNLSDNDTYSYRATPKYTYDQYCITAVPLQNKTASFDINSVSNLDLGLNRYTEEISGKNPFYDSYEKYSEDVKIIGQEFSIVPEFKISDYMNDAVLKYGGNFRKIKLTNIKNDIKTNIKDKLEKENNKYVNQDKITLTVTGVKKILPYNGFYPQDRSLQLVNDLKTSFINTNALKGGLRIHGATAGSVPVILTGTYYDDISLTSSYTLERYLKESSFLEPLFAPGIFYNLIKSGIAVDWAAYTGSIPYTSSYFDSFTGFYFSLLQNAPSYRMPFETILNVYDGYPISDGSESKRIVKSKPVIHKTTFASNYGFPSNSPSSGAYFYGYEGFCEMQKTNNPLYSLNMNNFLAESINFFLQDSKLNSFVSLPENRFRILRKNKKYYMDIVLRKSDNFTMCEGYKGPENSSNYNSSGRYFGPAFFTGSSVEKTNIKNNYDMIKAIADPASSVYAPPYYYGPSIARLSFTPATSRKYTLEEIFADINVEYINLGLNNTSSYPSGSLYKDIAMNLGASIDLFGEAKEPNIVYNVNSNTRPGLNNSNRWASVAGNPGTVNTDNSSKKWVISTKMETPVLDFSNQEHVVDTKFFKSSSFEGQNLNFLTKFTQLTSSGYGVGMWSGYGEIPTGSNGIFFEIKESFPENIAGINSSNSTASLLQACGFRQQIKRVGEIAEQKTVSEAILIIPYSIKKRKAKTLRISRNNILVNDTVRIENYNFFKINRNIFQKQRTNILSGKPAVVQSDFGSQTSIEDTSISNMITLMNKYVIPPNLNFLQYSDIHPFIMYIAEFETSLDKQDLADIWQGVMPKQAMQAEIEENIISHDNSLHDFFHGEGMPQDVRFLMFKVKRKAEINYFKMTSDSSDDERFRFDFAVGKKTPEYSYNWPYDYFSLVEMAKVDLEIDYDAKDNRRITIQPGSNASQAIRNMANQRAGSRGMANRGIIRNNGRFNR
jgi:hypothetical protein